MKYATFSATLVVAGILAATGTSCARRNSASAPASPARSAAVAGNSSISPGATATADPNSVPAIAQREVIRRQEMIRRMDEAAIQASQRMAEDDLEGAVKGYRRAMDGR
jgi:hypothetical protein